MTKIATFAVGLTVACSALLLLPPPAWGDAATTAKPVHVLVVAVADDQLSMDVTSSASLACELNAACNVMHLSVTDNVVKDQLKQLHKGDHIQIVYSATANSSTDAKSQYVLQAWCVDSLVPGPRAREWVLLGSAGAGFLLTLIFSGFRPTQLVISEDNRYSNSRFQMALWFYVLLTTYIAALWLRVWLGGWDFLGGVNIPQNLLLLSGMSAFTFAGAKGITASRTAALGAASKAPAGAPNFFRDLTHNDGTPAVPVRAEIAARAALGDHPAIAWGFSDAYRHSHRGGHLHCFDLHFLRQRRVLQNRQPARCGYHAAS